MQKINFIAQVILEMKLTQNVWVKLLLLWMFNHIQKFSFIFQLICEILYFKESCILIGLKVFRLESRKWFFIGMQFLRKVRKQLVLSYLSKKKKVRKSWLDFCQNPKTSFLGPPNPTGLFFSKIGLCHLYLTSYQKTEKTNESTLRSWAADRRTNGQSQIHGILPLARISKNGHRNFCRKNSERK